MSPDRAIVYSRDYQRTVASVVYYLPEDEPQNTVLDLAVALQLCQSGTVCEALQTTEVIAPLTGAGSISATGLVSQSALLRFTSLASEEVEIFIISPDPDCFDGSDVDPLFAPIAAFITLALASLKSPSGSNLTSFDGGVLSQFLTGWQAVLNACPRARSFGIVTDFWPQDGAIAKGDNP